MNSSDRVKLLMCIWIAFAVAAGWSFLGDVTNLNDIFLGMTFGIAAVIGTGLVLRFSGEDSTSSSKLKRGDTDFYRAIDAMDDEELLTLRRRLMIDNEPTMPLQDLMPRKQNQQQSQ